MSSPHWRVGTVPYLVARPLTAGLAEDPRIELISAPPATLAEGLRDGSLDVALASSVLALEQPPLQLWETGPVIAGDGAIRSVLLFLAPGVEGPEGIQRWFADPHSRTGRLLTEWLLSQAWSNNHAERLEPPPGVDPFLAALADGLDAVQLIGDPALAAHERYPDWTVVDLGSAWAAATGLPFLYAGWMARPDFSFTGLGPILEQAAARGLALREHYAKEAATTPEQEAFYRRYLCQDLRHHLPAGMAARILARLAATPLPSA